MPESIVFTDVANYTEIVDCRSREVILLYIDINSPLMM